MLRGRRFPRWLVRRSYFRRMERWAKTSKPARTTAEPAPAASNVLPFPEPWSTARAAPPARSREVGIA